MAGSKSILIKELVYTTNFVNGDMTVADLKAWFQTQLSTISLGVVGDQGFGLVTRNHLSHFLMGDRFQTDMLSRPVSEIMMTSPMVVDGESSIDQIATRILSESENSEDFYNDIIVTDSDSFLGLVAPRELLSNHIEFITHQLTAIQAQQKSLTQKNKKLFDHSFKKGFQDSQVRSAFEDSHVPIYTFNESGKLLIYNQRAIDILETTRDKMQAEVLFGHIFEEPFLAITKQIDELQKMGSGDPDDNIFWLTLKRKGGERLSARVFATIAEDQRLLINILEVGDNQVTKNIETPPAQPIVKAEAPEVKTDRPTGRVTQAIRNKVDESHAMGLARSVATNLIDREQSMDRLMEKLERIIQVAEQVEDIPEAPPESEPSDEPSGPLLAGNLKDFSVIDLCQVLSQGCKTGCLVIGVEKKTGEIYFDEGQICHARWTGQEGGMEDLRSLLVTKSGKFEFGVGYQPDAITITEETMGLLMDACQYLDEHD
ncbi:MAG: DUF4388 domain-containing protein [Verrucomicrobiota bacterium]